MFVVRPAGPAAAGLEEIDLRIWTIDAETTVENNTAVLSVRMSSERPREATTTAATVTPRVALARTGAEVRSLIVCAIGLMAVGAVLVSRRRPVRLPAR